uniref:UBL3-like ubiquitin domain-containing protein n=1 Tax=Odontella aurita TaxID=265563 RepID=A0A7S4K751_9STRA|mmetsp:Transcript_63237/g.186993  ORF Transcript_63237/g.186993 Transcript_63237/m.186993 type:complete len:310 (+) Transcript_63237:234-1163(+)
MGEEGPSAAAPSDTSAELSTEKEQLDPQRSMPSEEAETIDGGDVAPTLVDDDGRGKEREAADDYDAAPTEVDSAEEQTGAQQQSGETTDSSPDQTAGEEAGSEGSSYGEGENNPRQQKSPAPEADSSSSSAMADSNHSTAASSTAADSSAPTKCTGRAAPPPFVDDPSKITLRFIFANRDGLSVTVDLKPTDTVGEVKGALLSMWPDELASCSGGDRLRLICMGRGILMPDSRTLEACQVPVFKTHATPVNVSVRPEGTGGGDDRATSKKGRLAVATSGGGGGGGGTGSRSNAAVSGSVTTGGGCCIIM